MLYPAPNRFNIDRFLLQIHLFEASIDTQLPYIAVSYAWDNEIRDQEVVCNGRRLLVTKNAHGALRRLRRKMFPRYLWLDAICIDQSSMEDKNHQVAEMADIFRNASFVAVWFGLGGTEFMSPTQSMNVTSCMTARVAVAIT